MWNPNPPEFDGGALYTTTWHLVLRMVILSFHFMNLPMNSSCTEVASRGSLELGVSVATEDRPYLHAKQFSTRQSDSGTLCGLPLRGWAVVVPRCFHFKITAFTVDGGCSSRAEIWQCLWHPMTVPRWKSLSSSVRPFCCQCLSVEIKLLCARFYTPVCKRCGWNSRIH